MKTQTLLLFGAGVAIVYLLTRDKGTAVKPTQNPQSANVTTGSDVVTSVVGALDSIFGAVKTIAQTSPSNT